MIEKISRIPLREVWKHEALDFTKWLEENIDVLNGALGLELVNVEREQSAGAFSVDLVAEENDRIAIIENQLERSDHDHMGKVITYLTMMDAKIAIWIVAEPRAEHVKAISWLNESSSASFYLVKPEAKFEPTKTRLNGVEAVLPTYKSHLLCDDQGSYPSEMNTWEVKVVESEMKREGFSFWYRNPQQPGQSSLGIAYLSGEQYGIVRPDFIFFATQKDGTVMADIIDPHSLHLADALPKLQGLALFAETHAKVYRRIESVAEAMGKLRVLDLTNEDVRKGIADAKDAESLFAGSLVRDY